MKILHTVESYYPALGGMQEVVKQISERLVKMGHEVTIATSFNKDRKVDEIHGVKIRSFKISGNLVNGLLGDVEAYINFLTNSHFDIVTNFAAQQWATDIALENLNNIKGKKIFVPTGFSGFYLDQYQSYFHKMKEWMKNYDMNIFLSDDYRDINFARKNNIAKICIIPNGAGEDEFIRNDTNDIRRKFGIPNETFLVLHVGSFSGIKGHTEATEIFIRANLNNAVLVMIGNNNEKFRKRVYYKLKISTLLKYIFYWKRKIIITSGLARQETIKAFISSDVFLFPSNVECSPIVLFEAMASKTAFLTSDCGNSKEIIQWSGGGKLLPTSIDKNGYSHVNINSSVKLLREFYDDSTFRNKLATSGYQSWKSKFTWEIIAKKYIDLYITLINNKE